MTSNSATKSYKKLSVGVLISGRGSNLQALIKAAQNPDYPASIDIVISNKPDAPGIELAKTANIPVHIIKHKDFETRDQFDNAITKLSVEAGIELVCLAGFMRILGEPFVDHWQGRLINIHPSLLPAYKGLDVHRRMLDDAIKMAGCSVHYVTAQMDEGPIIGQRAVPVLEGYSPEDLAARILIEEHILYPECVAKIAREKLSPQKS